MRIHIDGWGLAGYIVVSLRGFEEMHPATNKYLRTGKSFRSKSWQWSVEMGYTAPSCAVASYLGLGSCQFKPFSNR